MLRFLGLVMFSLSAQVICERSSQLMRDVLPGIGSFALNTTSATWYEAEKFCRVNRGEVLAFPHSAAEATLMVKLMLAYNVDGVHAGFHDLHREGVYYTLTGDLVSQSCFQNWTATSPSNTNNCGSFSRSRTTSIAGMQQIQCNYDRIPFICVNYNYFKDDFDFVPGHGYYKLHRAQRTWIDAQQTCEEDGSQLLVLNSHEEFRAVGNKYGDVTAWVGVHHLYTNADFVTIFGESLSSVGFDKWQPGQPVGTNLQQPYVEVKLGAELQGGLAINTVTKINAFICEFPNPPHRDELRSGDSNGLH